MTKLVDWKEIILYQQLFYKFVQINKMKRPDQGQGQIHPLRQNKNTVIPKDAKLEQEIISLLTMDTCGIVYELKLKDPDQFISTKKQQLRAAKSTSNFIRKNKKKPLRIEPKTKLRGIIKRSRAKKKRTDRKQHLPIHHSLIQHSPKQIPVHRRRLFPQRVAPPRVHPVEAVGLLHVQTSHGLHGWGSYGTGTVISVGPRMQILTAGHNIFGGGGFYFEWEFFPGYNGINPPHYTINTQYYPTTPGGRWVIKEYRRYNINGNTLEEHKYDIGGLEFFANSVIILDVPPVTEPVSVTYVTRRPGNPTPMWSLTYLMPQLAGYGPIHAENGEPGENYQQRQISYNMHCERQFLTCWERDEYVHFGMSGSPVLFQPNHYQRYGNAIGNRINGILVTSFPEHWTYYDWRYYKNLMLNGNAHFFSNIAEVLQESQNIDITLSLIVQGLMILIILLINLLQLD
eukprot:249805_1